MKLSNAWGIVVLCTWKVNETNTVLDAEGLTFAAYLQSRYGAHNREEMKRHVRLCGVGHRIDAEASFQGRVSERF